MLPKNHIIQNAALESSTDFCRDTLCKTIFVLNAAKYSDYLFSYSRLNVGRVKFSTLHVRPARVLSLLLPVFFSLPTNSSISISRLFISQTWKRQYHLRTVKHQREQMEENGHGFIYQMLKLTL